MTTDITQTRYGLKRILLEGWRLYWRHFWQISLIVVIVYVPVNVGLSFVPVDDMMEEQGLRGLRLYLKLVQLTEFLIGVVATMAVAKLIESHIKGEPIPWHRALGRAGCRWPASVGTGLLGSLILLGCYLLLVVPGLIWTLYYYFVAYVVVLRGCCGKEALDYSKRLVKGQWWRTLGYLLAINLAGLIFLLPFAVSFFFLPDTQWLNILCSTASDVLLSLPLVMTVVFLLNTDCLQHGGTFPPDARISGKRVAGVFGAVVGFLLLIPVLILIGLALFIPGDLPPPKDADLLAAPRVEVADTNNVYFYLRAAKRKIHWPDDPKFNLNEATQATNGLPSAEQVLEQNRESLALLKDAANRSVYQPSETASIDAAFSNADIQATVRLAKLLAFQTRSGLRNAQAGRALDACRTLLAVAAFHAQKPITTIDYLAAQVEVSLAASLCRELARTNMLSASQLRVLAADLSQLGSLREGARRGLCADYRLRVSMIDALGENWRIDRRLGLVSKPAPPLPTGMESIPWWAPWWWLQPNRTKTCCAEKATLLAHCVGLTYREQKPLRRQIETTDEELRQKRKMFEPNGLGRCAVWSLTSTDPQTLDRVLQTECDIQQTRLLLLCRAYEMEHGELPSTLDALTPAYLEQVPVDPYDGKSMRYSRSKEIIYSVGADLIDSDGSERPLSTRHSKNPHWNTEDFVLHIRLVEKIPPATSRGDESNSDSTPKAREITDGRQGGK